MIVTYDDRVRLDTGDEKTLKLAQKNVDYFNFKYFMIRWFYLTLEVVILVLLEFPSLYL